MQVSYPPMKVFDAEGRAVPHREFFTDVTQEGLNAKMDARRSELEAKGHTGFARVKMGRNAQCPCGSGKKFKYCCIDTAR